MADMKLPNKNNPGSFNAGAKMKNNSVSMPKKHMDMDNPVENNKENNKREKTKHNLQNIKRNVKKEAIAIGVQLGTGVDRSVTKKALDNKVGDKLVDSMQSPGEKYKNNKEKIRQKRIERGEEPDYPMLWFDAMPATGKILLIFCVVLIIGLLFFVSVFASLFESNFMMKLQSFGYMSSQNSGKKITNSNISSSGTIGGAGGPLSEIDVEYLNNQNNANMGGPLAELFDGEGGLRELLGELFGRFRNIFGTTMLKEYANIGNIFSSERICHGEECDSRAEVQYYQKIADISYRYKRLYNVELDWPLIVATNLIDRVDKEQAFKENISEYGDINDFDEVIALDWEYDYENIEDYIYLDADDSRYDLQLLAKNMVTKTTVQSCVLDNEILETTTLIDVLDSDLTEESENYLECLEGEYVIESTYEVDMAKYDEFLSEYLEHKLFLAGSGSNNISNGNSGNNYGGSIVAGANSLANAFVGQARNQLNAPDNSIYWKYMGYSSRVPWCAAFVAWVTNNTSYNGQNLYPNIIKYKTASAAGYLLYFNSSSDSNVNFYHNKGCNKYSSKNNYTPKQGDLIFFDWDASWSGVLSDIVIGNGIIDHVGIVEKVENGYVYTIEGNSSNDVRSRHYPLSSCQVVGYGSWY